MLEHREAYQETADLGELGALFLREQVDALLAELAFPTRLDPQAAQVEAVAHLIDDAKEKVSFAQA